MVLLHFKPLQVEQRLDYDNKIEYIRKNFKPLQVEQRLAADVLDVETVTDFKPLQVEQRQCLSIQAMRLYLISNPYRQNRDYPDTCVRKTDAQISNPYRQNRDKEIEDRFQKEMLISNPYRQNRDFRMADSSSGVIRISNPYRQNRDPFVDSFPLLLPDFKPLQVEQRLQGLDVREILQVQFQTLIGRIETGHYHVYTVAPC